MSCYVDNELFTIIIHIFLRGGRGVIIVTILPQPIQIIVDLIIFLLNS